MKALMLDITIKLDISARLKPHVITIICYYMKKNIIKRKKKGNIRKYGRTRPKLIY